MLTTSIMWLFLAAVWFIMQGSRTVFNINNKFYDGIHAVIAILIGFLMLASIIWIRNPGI